MKKIILTILFLGVMQFGFSQDVKSYDYITLTMVNVQLNVSSSTGINEKFTYRGNEDAGLFKFTFLYKKVNEFEEKGWEVISSGCSGAGASTSYFILRKEKD